MDCFCLFVLMLNVPVNGNGHVGTLPPFHGTFTQQYDVMTLKICFIKYKTPKQINKVYMYG